MYIELVPDSSDDHSPETSPVRDNEIPENSPARASDSANAPPARASSVGGVPSPARESTPVPAKKANKKKAVTDSEDSDRASDCSFKMSDSDADDFVASDDDSEFELPVPKKSKKSAPAAKKKAVPKEKKEPAKRKVAIAKSPARRATVVKRSPARMAMKPAPAPRRKLNALKKAVGGKLPGLKPRSRQMEIPTARISSARGPSKLASGAPRFRSGLSRKDKIPRLHKYLKDE